MTDRTPSHSIHFHQDSSDDVDDDIQSPDTLIDQHQPDTNDVVVAASNTNSIDSQRMTFQHLTTRYNHNKKATTVVADNTTHMVEVAEVAQQQHHPHHHHRIDIDVPHLSSPLTPRWSLLPSDLIHVIAQHLDARSLSRLASVERTCHRTIKSNSNKYWLAILKRTNWRTPWLNSVHLAMQMKQHQHLYSTDPRQYYMIRLRHSKNMRDEIIKKQEKLRKNQAHFFYMRFYEEVILPLLIVGLICTFFALLVYQLTTRDQVNFLSLWPIFAVCFLVALSTCNLCYIQYRRPTIDSHPERFLSDEYYSESESFVKYAMEGIGNGEEMAAHATFCLMLISFVVFLILAIFRCTHTMEWHWSVIFIPLYIVLLFFCCSCWRWAERPRGQDGSLNKFVTIMLSLIAILLPILIFVILLVLFLIGTSSVSRLSYVFIPLYFIDLITLLYALHFMCDSWHRTALPFAIWLLTSGSFFVWKILLGLRVDGSSDISYALVFLPIFISLVGLLLTVSLPVVHHTKHVLLEEYFERMSTLAGLELPNDNV